MEIKIEVSRIKEGWFGLARSKSGERLQDSHGNHLECCLGTLKKALDSILEQLREEGFLRTHIFRTELFGLKIDVDEEEEISVIGIDVAEGDLVVK